MNGKITWWVLLGVVVLLIYGLLDPAQFPFPQCPFLSFTGWKCPGCGSQRAMYQFLHGNFLSSFKLNFLFIPALVYVMVSYTSMVFFPKLWLGIRPVWYSRRAALILLAIITFYWVVRNI